jgi:hypothetical protein
MAKKKTWVEKLAEKKEAQWKVLDADFADMKAGGKMLIATPQLLDAYIRQIGFGKKIDPKTMRKDLALEHGADYTCPVTTGIFLRIVAEASYEQLQNGASIDDITPFWRVIDPNSALAKKLSFGVDFLKKHSGL